MRFVVLEVDGEAIAEVSYGGINDRMERNFMAQLRLKGLK
jgi:hypothetical protein